MTIGCRPKQPKSRTQELVTALLEKKANDLPNSSACEKDKDCLSVLSVMYGGPLDLKKATDASACAVAADLGARFISGHGIGDGADGGLPPKENQVQAPLDGTVDAWLWHLKRGQGPCSDALRIAVANAMVAVAPRIDGDHPSEDSVKPLLAAVARAIPGSCLTYARLGQGEAPNAFAPEDSAEHSACVHKDLVRRDGPGAAYGTGILRAGEGALSVYREAERSLRMGLAETNGRTKAHVEGALAIIEKATASAKLKKSEAVAPGNDIARIMAAMHADAGVLAPAHGMAPRMAAPLKRER